MENNYVTKTTTVIPKVNDTDKLNCHQGTGKTMYYFQLRVTVKGSKSIRRRTSLHKNIIR